MRNIIANLLITTSALILFTACISQDTGEQRVGVGSTLVGQSKVVTASHEDIALADCELEIGGTQPLESWAKTPEEEQSLYEWTLGQTNTTSPPLDPETVTLEQILDRSRLAMGDIVTYKSCGTTVDRKSSSDVFSTQSNNFRVFHSYDHYRTVHKYSERMGGNYSESLSMGSRRFNRDSNNEWEELDGPPSNGMQPTPPSAGLASTLYEGGIKLISTNEVSDYNEKVFRLAFSETHEGSKNGEILQNTVITSVLVSQETFRIVTYIREQYADYEQRARSNGGLARVDWWLENIGTTHYYDYNLPVVLVVPDDYISWQESAMAR
jgi:hypothetical protein